jgi:hypothetical protein
LGRRRIRERDDDLDRLTAYVRGFARMMTELRGERLESGSAAGCRRQGDVPYDCELAGP